MPWQWCRLSIWWTQVLLVYLNASREAGKRQEPLPFAQTAPHIPSASDAARHLAQNANRVWKERYAEGQITYDELEQHLTAED